MRFARFGLLFWLMLLSNSVRCQQPQPPIGPATATKDPQAVSLVDQVLSVAGGVAAISTVTDYTGSGTITYHLAQDVQRSVTVRGKGLTQFRMDENLPTGTRSEVMDKNIAIKTENGELSHPYGWMPMRPGRLILPYLQLASDLGSSGFDLLYKGLIQLNGVSAHDIQVHRIRPGIADPQGILLKLDTVDFFIDPSTFQVVKVQDTVQGRLHRDVHYSNYTIVSGVLVPFSISEEIDGQSIRQIQLGSITFNSGLQDSDFQL